jgi:hypothetical protein
LIYILEYAARDGIPQNNLEVEERPVLALVALERKAGKMGSETCRLLRRRMCF